MVQIDSVPTKPFELPARERCEMFLPVIHGKLTIRTRLYSGIFCTVSVKTLERFLI